VEALALGNIDPADPPAVTESYSTELGTMYQGTIEDFLASSAAAQIRGKVQMIFTSPPFPLNRSKKYGNLTGDKYVAWLSGLAPEIVRLLSPDGSFVIELGNAWEPGKPVMSTLALEALLEFKRIAALNLCQQFVCHNPARLPSPVQWVNRERIRVKDSFTHIWWMSPSERPKADNRRVLRDYSSRMKKLLSRGSYNSGNRPSGHKISDTAFLTDNGGAIPPNVFIIPNTGSNDPYREHCRALGVAAHPAPMQMPMVEWFVKFLTDEQDLVFDPFGGSNSTGAAAETLSRRWIATEPEGDYILGSRGRFPQFREVGSQ
jgi:DNA modification methylase